MAEYSPLWELTLSRLREFYREPGAVFWVFGFPLVLALGLGLAFRNTPPEKPRVAVAADAGWIAGALAGSDTLDVELLSKDEALEALRKARVDLYVRAGDGRTAVYRYDAARPEARLARLAVDEVLQRALGRPDVVSAVEETVSEPGSRYIDFLLPGLIGLNLMGSSMWGIGYAVVMQRRNKLLKRLAATPMKRSHFVWAYVLSRLIFLAAEVFAIVLFGRLIFDVTVFGSYGAVAVLSLLGATCFAALALLVAARLRSVEVASGWMNVVMMPMWLLSGSFFSYERFPELLHPVIRALPLTAVNDALRAVMNDGAGLAATLPQVAVLVAWTLVAVFVALRTFRWQ